VRQCNLTIDSSDRGYHLRRAEEGVNDWDKSASFHGKATPRRSTSSLGLKMPSIRAAQPGDRERLLAIWLDSVRATHLFLTEADIRSLLPMVRDVALRHQDLWVLCDDDHQVVGFMGLHGSSVETLFIHPAYFRRGGGSLLLEHARQLKGPLVVDVNEQNPDAIRFYLAAGFTVAGRSPLDGGGRPFPLLHLREIGPDSGDADHVGFTHETQEPHG